MDRPPPPPSFPHYQNPNPTFFHHPPNPNPNPYFQPPPPPPPQTLSTTLSSLQSLISETQRTLASFSSHLQKNDFSQCPFNPNHLMPPESLFLHSLRCPSPLNLTHLTNYRNRLEIHCEELDSFTLNDLESNFFYKDCPGAVSFSEIDVKKITLTIPRVLCEVDVEGYKSKCVLEKCLLPSDFCVMKSEVEEWREYPSSYSFRVLCSVRGLGLSELRRWILVNSTRYGVVIDTYVSDHVFVLVRLCLKAVVKEACGFDAERRTFECPVLVRVLSWLGCQLGVLYGEGNGRFFALDMFKECVVESASRIMMFREGLDDADVGSKMKKPVGETLDCGEVISVSRVAAAVAALYERSALERKIRAVRYPQQLTRYQRVAELGVMTVRANEERKKRPNYRAIIDHDGLPRQRQSNEEMNKLKTKEELLAEERDYKRRRMSYRGKKLKRTPREVLRDIIEEYTEEIKLAGGIGCFEKGIPLQSSSSIGNNEKESELGYNTASSDASRRFYKQRKGKNSADTEYPMEIKTKTDEGKRYEEYDSHSGSSQRQQSHHRSHRTYKDNDRRDDEYKRTDRYSSERKSYHGNHKTSQGKSSSDYNTERDDPRERSRGSRNRNSYEDRYNPLEKE